MADPFIKDGRVRLADPDTGELVWGDAAKYDQAVAAGYKPVSEADHLADEHRKDLADSPVTAFLESAASTATFGAAPIIERALGVPASDIEGRREGSPLASAAGTIAGGAASMLIPGAPLARAAAIGERAAASAAARLAGQSLGSRLVAKVASTAVRGAVTGSAFGLSEGVGDVARSEDMSLGDAARHIVKSTGEGLAYGALTDLGFAGAGAAIGAAGRAAKRGISSLANAGASPTAAAKKASAMLDALATTDTTAIAGDIVRLRMLDMRMQQAMPGLRRMAASSQAAANDLVALETASKQVKDRLSFLQGDLGKKQSIKIGRIDTRVDINQRVGAQSVKVDQRAAPKTNISIRQARRIAEAEKKAGAKGVDPYDLRIGEPGDIEVKLARGEDLTPDEQYSVLWQNFHDLNTEYDNVIAANDMLRTRVRRNLRNGQQADEAGRVYYDADGIPVTEQERIARTTLEERKTIILEQREQLRADMSALRAAKFSGDVKGVFQVTAPTEIRQLAKNAISPNLSNNVEIKLALEDLSKQKEPLLDKIVGSFAGLQQQAGETTAGWGAKYLSWLSAPTILGYAVGGAPGAVISALATNPLARDIAGKALASTWQGMRAAAPALQATANAAVLNLTHSDIPKLRENLQSEINDPTLIQQDALTGYRAAGMPDDAASRLAQLQADRAQLLREYVPQNDDRTALRDFNSLYNSVRNPRSITDRLALGQSTTQDVLVAQRLFPELYRPIAQAATQVLRSGAKLTPGQERQMRLWAGQADVVQATTLAMQPVAFEPDKSDNAQSSSGAISSPDARDGLSEAMSTLAER